MDYLACPSFHPFIHPFIHPNFHCSLLDFQWMDLFEIWYVALFRWGMCCKCATSYCSFNISDFVPHCNAKEEFILGPRNFGSFVSLWKISSWSSLSLSSMQVICIISLNVKKKYQFTQSEACFPVHLLINFEKEFFPCLQTFFTWPRSYWWSFEVNNLLLHLKMKN